MTSAIPLSSESGLSYSSRYRNITMSAACSMGPESRSSESRGRRALVGAGLDGTRGLRYREDRDVEVSSQDCEAAADLRDLLLAILLTVALPDHELQVIHDDERERRLVGALELAGEAADLS